MTERAEAGFSLLETLVATAVLGMALASASAAYSFLASTTGRLASAARDREVSSALTRFVGEALLSLDSMTAERPALIGNDRVLHLSAWTLLGRRVGTPDQLSLQILGPLSGGAAFEAKIGDDEAFEPIRRSWPSGLVKFGYMDDAGAWHSHWTNPGPPRLVRLTYSSGTAINLAVRRAVGICGGRPCAGEAR